MLPTHSHPGQRLVVGPHLHVRAGFPFEYLARVQHFFDATQFFGVLTDQIDELFQQVRIGYDPADPEIDQSSREPVALANQ